MEMMIYEHSTSSGPVAADYMYMTDALRVRELGTGFSYCLKHACGKFTGVTLLVM